METRKGFLALFQRFFPPRGRPAAAAVGLALRSIARTPAPIDRFQAVLDGLRQAVEALLASPAVCRAREFVTDHRPLVITGALFALPGLFMLLNYLAGLSSSWRLGGQELSGSQLFDLQPRALRPRKSHLWGKSSLELFS